MTEVPNVSTGDKLFAALQYVLPKHLMSRVIYAITRSQSSFVKNTFLRIFLNLFDINMAEAAQPDPFAYRTFNDFFTRALKPGVRPVAIEPEFVVSPVDGTVSQVGDLLNESILQAKGQHYTLQELLAGDEESITTYRNGSFACIYLAPYNYHRIHMPYAGQAFKNIYVPGELFSVNASTARAVPRVFARNERLICEFTTPIGRVAVILVGALHVGSIETVHCGEVNPPPRRNKRPEIIAKGVGRDFDKGEELGRFNMGSTVVLLFERGRIHWDSSLHPNSTVQLGRPIARVVQ
jgi:phosphatidylserine decarboxylase